MEEPDRFVAPPSRPSTAALRKHLAEQRRDGTLLLYQCNRCKSCTAAYFADSDVLQALAKGEAGLPPFSVPCLKCRGRKHPRQAARAARWESSLIHSMDPLTLTAQLPPVPVKDIPKKGHWTEADLLQKLNRTPEGTPHASPTPVADAAHGHPGTTPEATGEPPAPLPGPRGGEEVGDAPGA